MTTYDTPGGEERPLAPSAPDGEALALAPPTPAGPEGPSSPEGASPADDPSRAPPFTHTRISGFWAAVVVGLLVLVVLMVFILENGQRARVSFFGAHAHLPEGVALLLAAVIGGLFVALSGAARLLEIRARSRRAASGTGRRPRRRRRPVAPPP